jgi:hypothetical protein
MTDNRPTERIETLTVREVVERGIMNDAAAGKCELYDPWYGVTAEGKLECVTHPPTDWRLWWPDGSEVQVEPDYELLVRWLTPPAPAEPPLPAGVQFNEAVARYEQQYEADKAWSTVAQLVSDGSVHLVETYWHKDDLSLLQAILIHAQWRASQRGGGIEDGN